MSPTEQDFVDFLNHVMGHVEGDTFESWLVNKLFICYECHAMFPEGEIHAHIIAKHGVRL